MAHFPVRQSYSTREIRETANRGQILQMRNGTIVADYGDTRITAADYGNGISAAFAACEPGDTILMRGVYAAGPCTLAQSRVKVICDDVMIVPKTTPPYSALLTISGADCDVSGIVADGKAQANDVSDACGIKVTGVRCMLRDVECNNILGKATVGDDTTIYYDANGLHIAATDVTVDGYVTRDVGYAGLILENANRGTFKNLKIINPHNRSINIQGANDCEWISIDSVDGLLDSATAQPNGPGTTAGVVINVNQAGRIHALHLTNIKMRNAAVVSAGNSYNHASTLDMLKVQNVDQLYMDNVQLRHGDNAHATGVTTSFRWETTTQDPPREVYIRNSMFSEGFTWGGQYPDYVHLENSHFGYDLCSSAVLIYNVRAKHFLAKSCSFNCYDKTRVFTLSASHAATDRFEIIDSEFKGNKATSLYVITGGIHLSAGNNLFVGNTLDNTGAGDFFRCHSTDDEFGNLSLTTDRNGDMLWDKDIGGSGDGKHPPTGAGPSFFTGLTVPAVNGKRILNTGGDVLDVGGVNAIPTQGWVSRDGAWVAYP